VRPAAVVFDLDGVLVDSEGAWGEAERETVASLGGVYTDELRAALHGRGHRDGGRIIAARLGRDDGEEVAAILLEHALRRIRGAVRAMPGAVEALAWARALGPVAVASNSVRTVVDAALGSAGLGDFDAVVTGEDVERPKPAPDPYVLACERVGVEPARALAVEDSPAGVASAKAAGLYVVGLQHGTVDLAEADRVVRSLHELTLLS
jgi:HAD superfamily hydrolase (TIGR01509 family)